MKKFLSILFLITTINIFANPVLPRDTSLMVSIDQTLSSSSAYAGQIFTGTLQSNLRLEDGTVIPVGSKVFGRVIDSHEAGFISGNAHIGLTLSEIQVDGFNYGVNTNFISFIGDNQGGDTFGKAVRGAAIGGVVNEIRGSSGSKGLKVGAAVGLGGALLGRGRATGANAGEIFTFTTTTSVFIGG